MSKNKDVIVANGLITKENGNSFFSVELDDPVGHKCLCKPSGRLTVCKIQLLVGDKVTVELSPYDLSKGRITLRLK
jgi:translation initiation factor IF-1